MEEDHLQYPALFAHWNGFTVSGGTDEKSPVTRECHAGILREPGGEIPPGDPTRLLRQRSSVTDKFEFIDAEYAIYLESDEQYVPSIVKMCRWMEVSRSGFYEWRGKPESATAKRRGILALYVQKSFGILMTRTGTGGSTRTWWPGACLRGRSWSGR